MELRYLYNKLVMRADEEDVKALMKIVEHQSEMREQDRMEGLT